MPEFLQDNGDGSVQVLGDDGVERTVLASSAQGMGLMPQASPPPAPMYVPEPESEGWMPQSQPPSSFSDLGISAPTISVEGDVAPSVDVHKTNRPSSFQTFGNALAQGADPSQAFDVASNPKAPPPTVQEQQPAEGTAQPSGIVMFREQAPQQPMGPQFATATSTTTGKSVSKVLGRDKLEKKFDAAVEATGAAAEQMAEAKGDLATQQAAVMDLGIQRAEKLAAQHALREKDRQADVAKRMSDIDATSNDLHKAVEEGKQSYWDDKSTGTRVAAAIGMALGAMGSSLGGGPNYAMQIIENAIDRDMKRKQSAVEGQRKLLSGKYSALDAARSNAISERDAEIVAQRDIWTGVDRQIAKLEKSATGEIEKAKAAEMRAEAQARAAQFDTQLVDRVSINSQMSSRRVPIAGAGIDDAPPGYIGGPKWNLLSKTEKAKAREGAAAFESALATTAEMRKLRKEYKTELFDSPEATRFANLANSAISDMARARDAGTIQAAEFERFTNLIGGSLRPKLADLQRLWGNDTTLNKIDAFESTIRTSTVPRLKAQFDLRRDEAPAPGSIQMGTAR